MDPGKGLHILSSLLLRKFGRPLSVRNQLSRQSPAGERMGCWASMPIGVSGNASVLGVGQECGFPVGADEPERRPV